MGWSIGYDSNWKRDIGYGVPATCDCPGCGEEIDRGLGHVCGGEVYGGEEGCGLYFCGKHLYPCKCDRCMNGKPPFDPTPDTKEWIEWKLADPSWQQWREENPDEVSKLIAGEYMNRPDRREEFKDVPWQQGRLLLTNETRRWSKEQRDEADGIERRTAFAHFSSSDEGRGREYVHQFKSVDECSAAVDAHNAALDEAQR